MPLENKAIEDLLHPAACLTVAPGATVSHAVSLMSEERMSSILVTEDDFLVGIFTERDFLNRVAAAGKLASNVLIQDVMTPDPESLLPTDSVGAAIDLMARRGFRNVPVVSESRAPLGVLRVREVIAHLTIQLSSVPASDESVFDATSKAVLRELGQTPVAKLANPKAACVAQTDPIREALAMMRDRHIGAVVVENSHDDICGIFTERDVVMRLAGDISLDAPVLTVMTPDPIRLLASFTVSAALSCMHAGRFRHIPLADDSGRAAGMISIRDILALVASRYDETAAI